MKIDVRSLLGTACLLLLEVQVVRQGQRAVLDTENQVLRGGPATQATRAVAQQKTH